MDLTTLAGPFATIVGLISSFESGRTGKASYQEFKEWIEKNHQEFVHLITENRLIVGEIEKMLKTDRARLIEIFRKLDGLLASIASRIDETEGLAKVVKPDAQLSHQSVSILKQLVDSGGSKIIKMHFKNGVVLAIWDSSGDENINISEKRFLIDDLNTLVEYGFLRHDYNPKGEDVYILTRNGAKFIEIQQA